MAKKNIPLLKRLRTRFLRMRHPKHFNMNAFAEKNECGTAMCIAGHGLDLQGYKVRFDTDGYDTFISPKGRTVDPGIAAQREMGLSKAAAEDLFYDFDIKTPKQAAARIEKLITEG